jgi:Ni/Fe-hydrogenase 1 B-type cytochrome subunit
MSKSKLDDISPNPERGSGNPAAATSAFSAGRRTNVGVASDSVEIADRESVYVWDLPVRITHWVNVITIGILSVTGFYIQDPFMNTKGIAADNYLMGNVRFVHFFVAFIFTANVLFRIYWSFAGTKYAKWHQFLPITHQRRFSLVRVIGYYMFLRKEPPAMVGHNPLAGLMYTLIHVFFVIQIITGFALYSLPFNGGFWPFAFGWLNVLLGIPIVRLVHTISMFLILGFVIQHIYSAVLLEIEERSGLLGSIVTGYKSLTISHIKESRPETAPDVPSEKAGLKMKGKQRNGS